ncbi:MAG: methyltransferase family protein [Chloroflexota bacterium]
MGYVLTGIAGFLVGYLFDFAVFRPVKGLRGALWLLSTSLIIYATVMLCLDSERWPVPAWAAALGGLLLALAGAVTVYCLFVDLPFRRTYLADGAPRPVVKTGSYALVRHPGVLPYAVALVGLALLTGSTLLLASLPLWVALDLLWVVIQEGFVFPKTIDGYAGYRRETPMLLPNRKSIAAFVRSARNPI